MMGVGMMIGAGAVIGMGHSVRLAGPVGSLVAFGLDGLLALFTAMAYAEMSSAVPKAGSIYNFTRISIGRTTGFTAGWIAWLASSVAGSFYAMITAEYIMDFLSQLGFLGWLPLSPFLSTRLVSVPLGLLFVWINYRGVSSTGATASFLTLGQTITLAAIGLFGLCVFLLDPSRIANFRPAFPKGLEGIVICMGFEYIAFEGYEVIAETGDEAMDPRRNLPKAILYSVLIVTLTYVVVALGLIAGVGKVGMPAWEWLAQFGEKGFGKAMAQLMPLGSFFALLTVLFAATSALNSTVYSAARVSYALGRDRMLPPALALISAKKSTPWVALIASGLLMSAFMFLPITDIASLSSILFLFLFLLADVCVLRMRVVMGEELRYGYLMPLFPVIPMLAIAAQLVLAVFIVNVSWLAWVIAPAWIAAGLAVYLLYGRSRALPIREEIVTVESSPAERPDARGGSRILVPVMDVDQSLALVPPVVRLAETFRGSVELLHMVAVPDQVPLSDAGALELPGREAIAEASLYLATRFPVGTSVLYCRSIARGILFRARASRAGLIVLQWRGDAPRVGFVFGATLDRVYEDAPCDVALVKGRTRLPYRRILVPVAGGPNSARALELALALADPKAGSVVTVLHVRRQRAVPIDLDGLLSDVRRRTGSSAENVRMAVVDSGEPVTAILEEARKADLVVLGATKTGRWRRMIRVSLPEEVAARCSTPLVIVKAGRVSIGPRPPS